jgi:hypothetical protein
VATQSLSALNFCRQPKARLLPISHGILYLACCVPADIVSYNSRIGNMPVINTIKKSLKGFSDQKALMIRTCGRDTTMTKQNGRDTTNIILVIFDNVQHFLRQQDLRIGRENSMIIGIAATFIEHEVDAAACDILDKC